MIVGWALNEACRANAGQPFAEPMRLMSQAGITINAVLMVLNLVPLPPLDGGRIAVSLLPRPAAYQLSRVEPYGFIIIVVLLLTGWVVSSVPS
jgi:Zn-dependent protease